MHTPYAMSIYDETEQTTCLVLPRYVDILITSTMQRGQRDVRLHFPRDSHRLVSFAFRVLVVTRVSTSVDTTVICNEFGI